MCFYCYCLDHLHFVYIFSANQIHAMYCAPSQNYQLKRIIESLLIVMTELPTTSSLMEFVSIHSNAILISRPSTVCFLILWCYGCYRSLFNVFEVHQRFQTERERRFLMHLILQYHSILEINSRKFCA